MIVPHAFISLALVNVQQNLRKISQYVCFLCRWDWWSREEPKAVQNVHVRHRKFRQMKNAAPNSQCNFCDFSLCNFLASLLSCITALFNFCYISLCWCWNVCRSRCIHTFRVNNTSIKSKWAKTLCNFKDIGMRFLVLKKKLERFALWLSWKQNSNFPLGAMAMTFARLRVIVTMATSGEFKAFSFKYHYA